MKKLSAFCVAAALAILPCAANAGGGKAIVPHWYIISNDTNVQHSNFFISNVTNHDLVVTITFYNKDGTVFSPVLTYNNFQNGNTEIGAGNSANLRIDSPASTVDSYGYATITWSNKTGENDLVGLIAWADWMVDSPDPRGFSIQVNGGNPF